MRVCWVHVFARRDFRHRISQNVAPPVMAGEKIPPLHRHALKYFLRILRAGYSPDK
ncbi:unnamed protein product, partial [Nesidiocoris tenuis]